MTGHARTAAESWMDVQVALGNSTADLLLKNCRVVNVYSQEIHRADIAVRDGLIVAVRENYKVDAIETVDASCFLAAPMPVSSSTLPGTLCSTFDQVRAALRHGETIVIRDENGSSVLELLQTLCKQKTDRSHICLLGTDALAADGIVAQALLAGFTAPQVFEMASLNPATALRIDHQTGSIAPGRRADILLIEEPSIFPPAFIYRAGKRMEGIATT